MNKFQVYKELEAVNYSLLKRILAGNVRGARKQSASMDLGSLVDCRITTPELFDELFSAIESKPGDKPKQIVDHLFDSNEAVPFNLLDKELLFTLMDLYEYRTSYTDNRDERRFSFFENEARNYYNERFANRNKIIVNKADVTLSETIAQSVINGRFTAPFHNLPFGIKVHNQVIVTWEYAGVPCKGLVDRILENTTNDPVMLGNYVLPGKSVLLIDYKTTGDSVYRFPKQMWKYRYDMQASWYSFGVNQWIAQNKPDVQIADFMFIVESTKYIGTPMIYRLSRVDKHIGRWGAIRQNGSYVIDDSGYDRLAENYSLDVLGWEQALSLYKWHNEFNEWEYPMEAVASSGILETSQYETSGF